MTSDSAAAERAAFIPDLGELASRIDVVLDHSWIDRGAFLRETLHGLRQAAEGWAEVIRAPFESQGADVRAL